MSSTTRVGFVVPAVTDFGDQVTYFDNNVTIYEAELPIEVVGSLPSSGNYAGRVRAVDIPAVANPPQPEYPYFASMHNGTAWIPLGSAGTRRNEAKYTPGNGSSLPNTSGPEVFQSAAMPGFSSLNVTAGQVLKFCCSYDIKWFSTTSQTMGIIGAFNILINPNGSGQPSLLTPGVVRLSDPIITGDDYYAGNNIGGASDGYFQGFYSELFYLVTNTGTMGIAVYLSATSVQVGSGDFVGISNPAGTGAVGVSLGIGATQFVIETCGNWSA